MPNSPAGTLPFFKYHGLGNDFVVIDALAQPALLKRNWHKIASQLCNRQFGVGADELLLICKAAKPHDVTMRVFNADGTDGGMCGNGIRCIAKHMVERHAFARETLHVGVFDVGARSIRIVKKSRAFVAAEVDMGEPLLSPSRVPCSLSLVNTSHDNQPAVVDAALPAALRKQLGDAARHVSAMTCVSMGNPHAVLWCKEPTRELVAAAGPVLQRSPLFPQSVNVHVACVTSRTRALMWTYERGSGVTLACGTGACAVLVAGVVANKLAHTAAVQVPGGPLRVRWDKAINHVFKQGPAAFVFAGTYAPR